MRTGHYYATRAEAEADSSFGADPGGTAVALLFALAFLVGCLLVGIAL